MTEFELFEAPEFTRHALTEELIRAIGRGICFSIRYKVKGFWSSDTITVYCQTQFYGDRKINFTISNSSGGRDTDELEFDEDAYEMKAAALLDACKLVRDLKSNEDKIMQYYAEYREELRIQAEKDQEERRKAEEADPLINEILAKSLVKDAISLARDNYKVSISGITFKVRRPAEKYDCMKVTVYSDRITTGSRARIGQKALIKKLTETMSWSSCKEARDAIFEQVKQ